MRRQQCQNHKIVCALRLAAFGRGAAVGDHSGRADEAEIPAEAQDDRCAPEMPDIQAAQC
ncbi:hypothetical protein RLEG12_09265 (plasmid) [Rhizobium leguminosarum bv. trifolii CB782]|nr:hypothetical protein RLEG12_09265 [Rhizobium leguminosarum bv. trifolii CB782]